MASSRRLLRLSTIVQNNTSAVDAYIEDAGLPQPSFNPSTPMAWDLPPDIDAARNAALEAIDELREHLLGPTQDIVSRVVDMGSLVSLHASVKFNIMSHLPVFGSISVPELAKASDMHVSDLDIIIRHGLTRRLFLLKEDGTITHSALSKALLDVPLLRNFVAGVSANLWTALPLIPEVMAKYPGSEEMEESAYKLAYGNTFWEDLQVHPQKAEDFASAMTFFHQNPALSVNFVYGYDWNQHANGTVVDLGGSRGEVAIALAQKYPNMTVVVQDRAEIVALAPAPHEKPENVGFQAHDFFKEQPLHGADVYFFRWIMHDWSAKYCIKILQALRPALKHKARIVLFETILPEPGVLSLFEERAIRNFDVVMKATYNAKERTEADWRVIIADADEKDRFSVVDVLQPAGSQLGFIVIEWTG